MTELKVAQYLQDEKYFTIDNGLCCINSVWSQSLNISTRQFHSKLKKIYGAYISKYGTILFTDESSAREALNWINSLRILKELES